MSKAVKTIKAVEDLTPDGNNANKGTERGNRVIENSLRELGAGRSIVVDKEGRVIAGNKTLENAVGIGLERLRVVQTRGDELVVVQRVDLDLAKDKKAKQLAIADNRAGQLNLDWDPAVLEAYAADVDLEPFGFTVEEVEALAAAGGDDDDDELPDQEAPEPKFIIVIDCADEGEQLRTLEKLQAQGITCRAMSA